MVEQIELLAFFAAALERATLAESLRQIAQRLRPDGNDSAGRAPKSKPQGAGQTTERAADKAAPKPRNKEK